MGVGTVDVTRGAFINEGFIRPGTLIGVLRIQGKLRQQPAGTIEFESQGETPGTSYDQLAVTDSAELDGTLKATFVLPASAGDRLSVLTAGACAGEFSTVRASGLADSLFPQPQYASGGVDLLVVAGVLGADEIAGRVGEPWLGRAYPSPARGEFAVDFELPAATSTRLTVHDVSGRAVATLLDAVASGGRHHSRWNGMVDGRPAPSGVYFVRMDVPGATRVRRVILTR
jgi:hypothetical protein